MILDRSGQPANSNC